jgi:serpin B
MRFDLVHSNLHDSFRELDETLRAAKGSNELSVANSIWPHAKYPLLPEFLQLLDRDYGAVPTPVDYTTGAEQARREINDWVAGKTRDRIKDILAPGALNAATRLALVNAIYFKGAWTRPFKESQTRAETFHATDAESFNAWFMRQTGDFAYTENEQAQLLALPYRGNLLEMVLVLPRKTNGVHELESRLDPALLAAWIAAARREKVVVSLPKFKMTLGFGLAGTLQAMGMKAAFAAGGADFSGMDGRPGWLYIGSVTHKAFVEVNETGTEAAAATVVAMKLTAVHVQPRTPVEFRADHPFLFLIRERSTGAILFLGRVSVPTRA